MGTKTQTDTSQKFDPGSMNRYQGWQSSMMPVLQQLFQNPTGSPFFNQNLQQNTKAATQVGGRNASNALLNFQRSGIGGGSLGGGAKQSLLAGIGRYNSSLQYQGFSNTMNQAQSDRWNAGQLGSAMFQPLNTGSSSTQTTGGLGTWLPQLAGAAIGGLTGALTGGFGGGGAMPGMGGGGSLPMGSPSMGSLFGGGGGSPFASTGFTPPNPFMGNF